MRSGRLTSPMRYQFWPLPIYLNCNGDIAVFNMVSCLFLVIDMFELLTHHVGLSSCMSLLQSSRINLTGDVGGRSTWRWPRRLPAKDTIENWISAENTIGIAREVIKVGNKVRLDPMGRR